MGRTPGRRRRTLGDFLSEEEALNGSEVSTLWFYAKRFHLIPRSVFRLGCLGALCDITSGTYLGLSRDLANLARSDRAAARDAVARKNAFECKRTVVK